MDNAPNPENGAPVDENYDYEAAVSREYTSMSSGYRSPLVQRVEQARLSVEMLQEEIPLVKDGARAAAILDDAAADLDDVERETLQSARREGERAKERLFAAALPLIRVVALKEWRRRQQWGSQVPLEDLVQDANLGFLKGLAAFKPEAIRRSPTNYLGQWMQVEMRRSSESMDHDLKVGRDAGERFRRIRALRSRLLADLGREPTDEEVAEASRNPNYTTRPSMLGPAPGTAAAARSDPNGITAAQVAEEREARGRVGHTVRFETVNGERDTPGGSLVDPERLVHQGDTYGHDPAQMLTETSGQRMVAALVARVIKVMNMPDEQTRIVALRYGLPPHDGEMSVREISRTVGVHRERVMRILEAFSTEIGTPGGPFHRIVSVLSEDDLDALGLLWAAKSLGPWDARAAANHRTPRVLTDRKTPKPSTGGAQEGRSEAAGVLAWYACPRPSHKFSALYQDAPAAPKLRECPTCGSQSVLIHTQNGDGGSEGRRRRVI